jgi:hypothetical protein
LISSRVFVDDQRSDVSESDLPTAKVLFRASTDRNTGFGTYSYTVTAKHTSGKTAKHDPRIENGGGLTS